jgi:hypothetical protein
MVFSSSDGHRVEVSRSRMQMVHVGFNHRSIGQEERPCFEIEICNAATSMDVRVYGEDTLYVEAQL